MDIRPAEARDEPFLRAMLVEAATWRPELDHEPANVLLADPAIALYVEDWGRAGDRGIVAEQAAEPLGAAWYRIFPEERHGYGFLGAGVPELGIGVRADARGRGIGSALLRALLDVARADGFDSLSLSVEENNPALRLYERVGFERIALDGNAWTMRRSLRL